MGQLVEWSLPTPEVHGSNPVISKIYNEKEARNGPFLKNSDILCFSKEQLNR